MKTLAALVIILFTATAANAAHLVCDPNPSAGTGAYYVITETPACVGDVSKFPAEQDGSLYLDVSCVAKGSSYDTTVKVCNVWGDCSAAVPFTLSRPAANPNAPAATRISR